MQLEQSICGALVRENMAKVRCLNILVHWTNHSGPTYSITINSSESTMMRIDGSESKSEIKTYYIREANYAKKGFRKNNYQAESGKIMRMLLSF